MYAYKDVKSKRGKRAGKRHQIIIIIFIYINIYIGIYYSALLGLQNKDLDSYIRIREDIVVMELLGENVRNRKIISASVRIILLNFFFS